MDEHIVTPHGMRAAAPKQGFGHPINPLAITVMSDAVPVVGYCDGIKGDDIYGWAWRPDLPNEPVEIDIYFDGQLVQSTLASTYRPDLRAAGVGHGRYGWKVPFGPIPSHAQTISVVVQSRDGSPLVDGVFDYIADLAAADQHNVEFQTFVADALGLQDRGIKRRSDTPPRANFLVYTATPGNSATMGLAEYSYAFVLKAFRPVLEKLGVVHDVSDALDRVDDLQAEQAARGETSMLLSFAPPHRMPMGLRCPFVPVIAWEFSTIPTRAWDDDPRHDWRFALRQAGRAIVLCRSAAAAIKATMGAGFPVATIPAPVWNRLPSARPPVPPATGSAIVFDGFLYDTRGQTFRPAMATPQLPDAAGIEASCSIALDGIVFTSVFSPREGRKNWTDIVSAFLAAHGQTANANLVLKMVGPDATLWWWELHDVITRMPTFACRIVVVHGFMTDNQYATLVAATHWIVNASRAEGLCLPLLEFMSAGRPAIAPAHTAMADYIDPCNAMIVPSDEEFCGFPHDPLNEMMTTRYRVSWSGLRDAFIEAYLVSVDEPGRYAALAEQARTGMCDFCSDDVVAASLDSFLGLNAARSVGLSALLSEVAAA